MAEQVLNVTGLAARVEDKQLLHGVDLTINKGETHVLMGPNGAGKSTLGYVLMGAPKYTVTGGQILFKGEDITHESTDKRAKAGMFLSFQEPLETGADSGMLTLADVLPDLATMEEDCELRDAAAQLRQLGAIVAYQVVKVVKDEIRHPLLLRRQRGVLPFQSFIELLHSAPVTFVSSSIPHHTVSAMPYT